MMVFQLFKYFISLIYWNMQPVEKVKKMQLRKFKEVFEYAREHNPFYHDLYTKAGVMDLDIKTWEDVEKVPIVDKDEYRRIPLEQRLSEPYNPKKHYKHSTSGSSGNPLMIVYSKFVEYTGHVRVFYMLVKAAHYNPFQKIFMIARYEEDDKFAIEKDLSFIGKLQKWLHFFQREIVSIYRDPDYIIDRILEEKPKIIWATPSVMEIVANRLIVRDIKLNIPHLVFTSENVSEVQFRKFKEYVSPVVIDLFGANESPSISFDVNKSGKSWVYTNACLPEFINRTERNGKETGTLVITSLLNKVNPFIRYNLKDYGEILSTPDFPNKCIGPIIGRMDDILSFPDGRQFFHHQAHEMFMDFDKCLHFKFVQVDDGPITLQLICNPKYTEAEVYKEAMERWNHRFPQYELKVEFVEKFEINKRTGKYKNIEHIKTKK